MEAQDVLLNPIFIVIFKGAEHVVEIELGTLMVGDAESKDETVLVNSLRFSPEELIGKEGAHPFSGDTDGSKEF